ncbi:MAG: TlpA family protein disulfide reductase [Hahellaceae bacterium]|nr:TlpA family protein disulfide reductase [Hahellaceae bacterium]
MPKNRFLPLCLFLAGVFSFELAYAVEKIGMEIPEKALNAPIYELPDLQGNIIQTPGKGGWTLMNFWATYCGPCRNEMPALNRLHSEMGKTGLAVQTIALDGDRQSAVRKFKERFKLELPILLDNGTGISREFSVSALPVSFLVNEKGVVVGRFVGERDWDSGEFKQFLSNKVLNN